MNWIRYLLARIGIIPYRVRIVIDGDMTPLPGHEYQYFTVRTYAETNCDGWFGIAYTPEGISFSCNAGKALITKLGEWYDIKP